MYIPLLDLHIDPCDICLGLRLHDRRVLLGGTLRVPYWFWDHPDWHSLLPPGIQVEETSCGAEDPG